MRLKRSGQALEISTLLPHFGSSVAVTCPACPQPGMNMPDNWKELKNSSNLCVFSLGRSTFPTLAACSHVYTLFLGIDGNYRAILKKKRHDVNDVPLLDGQGYFADTADYEEYSRGAKDDVNEVRAWSVSAEPARR